VESMRKRFARQVIVLTALAAAAAPSAFGVTITGTFTANFNSNFGSNAAAAQAAWNSAANVFSSFFTDNIHINITVDAVAGTSVFGQSSTSLVSTSYGNLRTLLLADSKTADDATALGAGGSMTSADPISGAHSWWVSRAEAKAIGLIADDGSNDGTTTFGTGNPFTFNGAIAGGTYDFEGVAAHEISEVMGRLGLCNTNLGSGNSSHAYSLADDYSYTGPGVKAPGKGPGQNFSIDNGTTLLKTFNDASANGLDCRDWAPGTNDAFNQFSGSGVVNGVSAVDLRFMDVLGYDLASPVPEPATVSLVALGFGLMAGVKKLRSRRA
jgi:PEP-CTERM motif-containing protein